MWYPTEALETTYAALARIRPRMRPDVCRAAIYCDYQSLFDDLMTNATGDDAVKPTRSLLIEAESSWNPHYRAVIERKASESGISLDIRSITSTEDVWPWLLRSARRQNRSSSVVYHGGIPCAPMGMMYNDPRSIYDGSFSDTSEMDLGMTIPESWQPTEEDEMLYLDYKSWPPIEE